MISDCPSSCPVSATVTINVTEPSSKVAIPQTLDIVGGSGVIPSGASSLSFYNYGPEEVTINNSVLSAGASIHFPFLGYNITYQEISYDAGNSKIRIDYTILSDS